MINLSQLNKLLFFTFFLLLINFNSAFAATAEDIWKNKKNNNNESNKSIEAEEIIIKNTTLGGEVNKITIKIDENQVKSSDQSLIGILDPEKNNFNLNMWSQTSGEDIKKVLNRINKLKLSKLSEDLLFNVLFTNAYPPKDNLNSKEFLKIKINWLIEKKRIRDLESLLNNNPEAARNTKAIKFLINEYLSSANIKSACEKTGLIDRQVQNNYLEKMTIYCLINNDRKNEAQLIFDLLLDRGFKDKFFENKINFLLGIKEKNDEKILDNNLLNFYLSHVTSENFKYEPNDKTDKYIWRYLSSANLVQVKNFENEDIISTYEIFAAQNSFENDEIFKIYLGIDFHFNQLLNAQEIYKNLPNYKARALIYQSILLTSDVKKKIDLVFLLKKLFMKDKLSKVYAEELVFILKSIDPDQIPENYKEIVNENLDKSLIKKIKFNNDILHRSKVIKHFLGSGEKINRTEKDFKSIYKKIKKNKKYFLSIKDIIVLESLAADGIPLPTDLDYTELSSNLTVPKNLEDLAKQNQIGLVMLKIIEIIGEDDVADLDHETVYFLNKKLNELNLKKIRNNILSQALPVKV